MTQNDLIARITNVLNGVSRVEGALLGGSLGRGEADDYSDVDVFVVVSEAAHIPGVLAELANDVAKVAPVVFSKVLPNARTINSITADWQRFDLTVVSQAELVHVAREQCRPLFDRLGAFDKLPAAAAPRRHVSPDALLDIVNEFIRVLGLSAVVHGRDDPIVAQTGTNLLRDMLIRIMVIENGPQPQRGVLALRRSLTPDQIAALKSLPPVEATWPSVLASTQAIAEVFFPRARALADTAGAAWPAEFERATLAHLEAKLGLKIARGDAPRVGMGAT